ncbi:MAG: S8 family serine peptidase, partial [Candidatus Bathyarchaeales archaeon]
ISFTILLAISGFISEPFVRARAIDDVDNSGWQDDVMAPYSSFGDPISPNGDREKPEVVAVGSRMYSTTPNDPWVGSVGEGTSYSAPQVAAEAALLMQTRSWLQYWPETVKAAIMASAIHNIEGDSRLSDRDGAGAIDIFCAQDLVAKNQIDGRTIYRDSTTEYAFNVDVGKRVRVTIAWDSHPDANDPPTTDQLLADLDLVVYDPLNRIVAVSASWDNSYEIVDFTASVSGTYKARVIQFRFDGTYEYLGFAWTQVFHSENAWTYGGYGTAHAHMETGEDYLSLVSWLGTSSSGLSRVNIRWRAPSNCKITVQVQFTVKYKIWSNWFFGIAWIHVTGWIYPQGQPLLESYNYHANSVSFGGSAEYSSYLDISHEYGSTLQGGTTYDIWVGLEAYTGNLAGVEGYAGAPEAYLIVHKIIISYRTV